LGLDDFRVMKVRMIEAVDYLVEQQEADWKNRIDLTWNMAHS
jgi:hypothetical protein